MTGDDLTHLLQLPRLVNCDHSLNKTSFSVESRNYRQDNLNQAEEEISFKYLPTLYNLLKQLMVSYPYSVCVCIHVYVVSWTFLNQLASVG